MFHRAAGGPTVDSVGARDMGWAALIQWADRTP